jgi:hypothetical protein
MAGRKGGRLSGGFEKSYWREADAWAVVDALGTEREAAFKLRETTWCDGRIASPPTA